MAQIGSNPIDGLILMAKAGNGMAFTALWDMYIDSLRSFIRKSFTQLDVLYVDDVCSRSFEKAFRQISTYDPNKSQFLTWLRTIARNTALDLMEREFRTRSQEVSIDDGSAAAVLMDDISDTVDTPLDSIIKTESREETQRYIERLPELYREVARHRMLDGMQYKEIAEAMDMELNTVRTRIRRAKGLMDKMRKEDELEAED